MSGSARGRTSGKSMFEKGIDLFSVVMSAGLTIWLGPLLYHQTVDAFVAHASDQFFSGWDPFYRLLWMLFCGAASFGGSLVVTALTLRAGAAKISGWLFGG